MSDVKTRMIVCGGRNFDQYEYLEFVLDYIIRENGIEKDDLEIISGHCQGADQYGEDYAKYSEIKCKVFPTQREKYGRKAGPIRNSQMIGYTAESENPIVVAFISSRTRGTLDTIDKARRKGIKVYSYSYTEMAMINPRYCKDHQVQVEIEQHGESKIPHMHVYHSNDRNLANCSYIRLDAPEYYSDVRHKGIPLTEEIKKQFLEVMNLPFPGHLCVDKDGKIMEMTGYQYAVQTWVDTFEEDYSKFEMDEKGLAVMPDYAHLPVLEEGVDNG